MPIYVLAMFGAMENIFFPIKLKFMFKIALHIVYMMLFICEHKKYLIFDLITHRAKSMS